MSYSSNLAQSANYADKELLELYELNGADLVSEKLERLSLLNPAQAAKPVLQANLRVKIVLFYR